MKKIYWDAIEFINAINELESDELKYEYISVTNNYELDSYNNTFRLITTDKLGIVGTNWSMVTKRIVLPTVMPTTGISYYQTFMDAIVRTEDSDCKLIFGQYEISTERLFTNATFVECDNGLTIQDSCLRANGMFFDSRELRKVTFDNCELGGMKYLFTHSDVENVTFRKCSLMECDYGRNYQDVGASKVFNKKLKTLTLKQCDVQFVDTIVGMFEDDILYSNLEIDIVD